MGVIKTETGRWKRMTHLGLSGGRQEDGRGWLTWGVIKTETGRWKRVTHLGLSGGRQEDGRKWLTWGLSRPKQVDGRGWLTWGYQVGDRKMEEGDSPVCCQEGDRKMEEGDSPGDFQVGNRKMEEGGTCVLSGGRQEDGRGWLTWGLSGGRQVTLSWVLELSSSVTCRLGQTVVPMAAVCRHQNNLHWLHLLGLYII